MKNLFQWMFVATVLGTCFICSDISAQQSGTSSAAKSMKVGVVNTKKCLESSKIGKQEQANFEKMKNQMESVLMEKEKSLEELDAKLNDDDYMDSISEDTANELRSKRRKVKNDGMTLQNQYMQTLQQANMKIVQKLQAVISKASTETAQDPANSLDLILTDEGLTYFASTLDVTDRIVAKMDAIFDQEQKDTPKK